MSLRTTTALPKIRIDLLTYTLPYFINKWDIKYWPRKNNIQIRFFSNLVKKFALCVYGEYAKRRKMLKLSIRISCLIIEHHEKNFRSSHHILDRFDSAKTPSHDTVPLNGFHSMKGGRNFLLTSAPVTLRKTYLSTDT
jgi:hypothetical protein